MLEVMGQLSRGSDGDSVVRVLAEQAPTWFAQFPALVKPAERDLLHREIQSASRERMLREMGDALETLTSSSLFILIFEDLHWVDHSTVDLISALARRRAPAQLMLLATYRPADLALSKHPLKALKDDLLAHRLCVEIALKPLSEAQVLDYLSAQSSSGIVPDGFAAALYRHAEGNPLFIVAAIDHLIERGLISRENGGWQLKCPLSRIDLEVPENLRQMIQTQIERLTDEDQRALELAAVAGLSFSPAVIAAGAGLDVEAFEERCDRLSQRQQLSGVRRPNSCRTGECSNSMNSCTRCTAKCFTKACRLDAGPS
jgi:predicted ATPase